MNNLKKLVGKKVLAAAAITVVGASTAVGADYIYGSNSQTPLTGFTAGHHLSSAYAWVNFYWGQSTEGQYKKVAQHRISSGDVLLYDGDGNSFFYDAIFNPNADWLVGMECWLYQPNWGYQWYHSWASMSTQ